MGFSFKAMWRNKCPRCRKGDLFVKPFNFSKALEMPQNCSFCKQSMEPEPGFYYGAMFLSYILSSWFLLLPTLMLVFYFKWSVGSAMAFTIVLACLTYFKFLRGCRSLWLHLMVKHNPSIENSINDELKSNERKQNKWQPNLKKMSKVVSIVILFFLSSNSFGQTFLHINVNQAKDTIEANLENEYFTILDVRTPSEYYIEHLAGAYNRDFYDNDFEIQLDSLDKNRIYLIYCRSGNRSGKTLEIMQGLEFKTVYNMLGGINDWNAQGFLTTDEIPDSNPNLYTGNITNILDLNIKRLNVFPNPTHGIIDLEFQSNIFSKVFTLEGEIVFQKEIKHLEKLDISWLENGLYFLTVENADGILFLEKIIKI